MIVREMRRTDVDRCVELGAMMHQEGVYRHLPYDVEHTKTIAEACAGDSGVYKCFVAEDDGIVFGMIAGYLTGVFFSPKYLLAHDMVLYVQPEFRGHGTVVVRLIKSFEKWAKASGAFRVLLGITVGINDEQAEGLYARLGYKLAGQVFKKELT